MTKTNVQPTPSNSQHHDTPNNKTHVIKFRVTAEEKASLELTCKLLNLSLSTFIRRAIHNVKIEKTVIVAGGGEATLTAVSTLLAQCSKVGSKVETAVRVSSPPPATMIVFSILTLWMARRIKVERERFRSLQVSSSDVFSSAVTRNLMMCVLLFGVSWCWGIARGQLNIRFGHCTSCLFDNSSVKLCKHDTPLLFAPSGANHEQGLGQARPNKITSEMQTHCRSEVPNGQEIFKN